MEDKEFTVVDGKDMDVGGEAAVPDVALERIALQEALDGLPEQEQKIIQLRYFQNQSQRETAKELGISQSQVSRLEKQAFERIRKLTIIS